MTIMKNGNNNNSNKVWVITITILILIKKEIMKWEYENMKTFHKWNYKKKK